MENKEAHEVPRWEDILALCADRGPEGWTAQYGRFALKSVYQPVYSIAHRREVGVEALLRATDADGAAVPPLSVFGQAEDEVQGVFVDRLTRALHVLNFQSAAQREGWLFLNINPQVITFGRGHGRFFHALLENQQLDPRRVVVEILERQISDEDELEHAVDYYRTLGCLVAIDDFGAGHSNFDRIWRLQPNLVKLDRSMIVRAAADRRIRRLLPGIVALLHETGCLVVIEGIETEAEALIALDADADLVQGYYFARPRPLPEVVPANDAIERACRLFPNYVAAESEPRRRLLARYLALFTQAAALYGAAGDLASATFHLIGQPLVLRCYLLDEYGHNAAGVVLLRGRAGEDARYRPLVAPHRYGFRRPFFRRALTHLGEAQVSRPYPSIEDGRLCLTLSMALRTDEGVRVLCCDLRWDETV